MLKKMVVAIFLAIIAVAVVWYMGQWYKKNSLLNEQMVRLMPESN